MLNFAYFQIHRQRSPLDNGNDLSASDLEQRLVSGRARGLAGLPLYDNVDRGVLDHHDHRSEAEAKLINLCRVY